MSTVESLGALISAAVKAYGESSDRSVQSAQGKLGPSDIGFCRNKAALMIRGIEQSDSTSIAAAQVGTAMHTYIGDAIKAMFPTWIIDSQRFTATLPSGVEVSGTPDIVIPEQNAIIDIKTVDGFEWVKRNGTSQNHKFQRHLYAMGAVQAGVLDGGKTVYVGNIYFDRSGKEPEPYFVIEEMDPTLTDEIDAWISDVTYAVINKEDAMRDVAAPVCEKICSYYTVCRGALPTHEGGEFIEDHDRVEALRMYIEARDMAKVADKQKREAQAMLVGTNGIANIDGESFQLRWTHINGGMVDAFEKQPYDRMDVRKVRR
jgi:CRISPR/Cas system-associated exonuclease Cas4 (RecB family)